MALLNTKSSRPANKTTGAVVNIPMSVGDSFYRYQRPDLSIKVVGIRGGARTVLSNIVKVAEALYCPASYPTKYFGIMLGAKTSIPEETPSKKGDYSVNGTHEKNKLDQLLELFIANYLLCPTCEIPEIDFIFGKKTVSKHCVACGNTTDVKVTDKFGVYLLRHPTTVTRRLEQNKAKTDLRTTLDTPLYTEPSSCEPSSLSGWSDLSQESMQSRFTVTVGGASMLFQSPIPSSAVPTTPDSKSRSPADEVKRLFPTMFGADMRTTLSTKIQPLLPLLINSSPAQKSALECTKKLALLHPSVLHDLPYILDAMYDCEALSEESVMEWHSQLLQQGDPTSALVAKSIEPFVHWLQTAEVDNDT